MRGEGEILNWKEVMDSGDNAGWKRIDLVIVGFDDFVEGHSMKGNVVFDGYTMLLDV